jgi:hypothetical protein
MRTYRFCCRCLGMTEHYESDPPRLSAALAPALAWPLSWLVDRWADAPSCVMCLERDVHRQDPGED